jgi:hypothetical protein
VGYVLCPAIAIDQACLVEPLYRIGYRTQEEAVLLQMVIGVGVDIRMLEDIVIGIPCSDNQTGDRLSVEEEGS